MRLREMAYPSCGGLRPAASDSPLQKQTPQANMYEERLSRTDNCWLLSAPVCGFCGVGMLQLGCYLRLLGIPRGAQ